MIVIIKTVLFRTDIASIPVVRTLMVIYYYSDDDADASNANKNNDADNDDDVGGSGEDYKAAPGGTCEHMGTW